jgi:CRISPR-associated exonuclease Cas4
MVLFIPAFLLLIIGIFCWILSVRQRRSAGLPDGRIIYLDTTKLRRTEGTFFSPALSVAGRPDYLVNRGGVILPVEMKSSSAPPTPHASHIHQLAIYALLVEEHFGKLPPFGILKYKDQSLEIPMTADLIKSTRAILHAMQAESAHGELPRSHDELARCRNCGFRSACGESLE